MLVLPVPREPDEQVRVVDLALLDGVRQRPDDVLLADYVGERPGAVAAVERGSGRHFKSSLVPRPGGPTRGPTGPNSDPDFVAWGEL